MADPTRPATGYPTQLANGYPPPPPPPQANYYYPNPNQTQNYYEHAQPQPPRATTTFARRFISGILFFFIILSIIYFIIWLILRPRVPIFTVDSVSLTSLNLSTTTSEISATWTVSFTVANPNKKLHAYYDEMEVRISYESSPLALNQLPPFDQATKSQSSVVAKLVAVSAYISPELVRRFEGDRKKGVVRFDVTVLALVRFRSGGWKVRRRGLRAYCDDLSVSVSSSGSNGSFSGGSRRCGVGI